MPDSEQSQSGWSIPEPAPVDYQATVVSQEQPAEITARQHKIDAIKLLIDETVLAIEEFKQTKSQAESQIELHEHLVTLLQKRLDKLDPIPY